MVPLERESQVLMDGLFHSSYPEILEYVQADSKHGTQRDDRRIDNFQEAEIISRRFYVSLVLFCTYARDGSVHGMHRT